MADDKNSDDVSQLPSDDAASPPIDTSSSAPASDDDDDDSTSGTSPQAPVAAAPGAVPVGQSPAPAPAPAPDASAGAPVDPNAAPGMVTPQAPPLTPNQIMDHLTNPTAQQMDQNSLAFYQDIANRHIQQKTYKDLFANKSIGAQLGLAFSVLAGGIGAGLTHQSNAALDIMNKILDRDFEQQKLNKENANTFLKTEYDHQVQTAQKNLTQAQANQIPITSDQIRANTKNLQADAQLRASNAAQNNMKIAVTAGEFTNMVNNMPDGPAKQNAQAALQMVQDRWQQDISNRNSQTAAQLQARSALRNSQANPANTQASEMQPTNAEQQFANTNKALTLGGMGDVAQYNQEHHFPGIGNTSQPMTPQDRENVNSGVNFQNELQGFINWTRAHSGSLNPSEMNEGQALAAQLQSAYRSATNGGVYKEGEQNFISKIITDNPTAFFNEIRKVPQLEAVQRESKAQLNQQLKSLGFQNKPQVQPTWTPQKAQQNAQAPAGEGGIPPDGTKGMAGGKPFTWKNGKRVYD